MKVQVKHSRKVDGHLYAPGLQTLKKEHVNHWFVKAQLKDGIFKAVEEPVAEETAEDDETVEAPADESAETETDAGGPVEEPKAKSKKKKAA